MEEASLTAVGAESAGIQASFRSITTVNLSMALQSAGFFPDAGTSVYCDRYAILQL